MEAITLKDGLSRIEKLELINALTVLKIDAKDNDKQIIDDLISDSKLHLNSHTQLDLSNRDDSIKKIRDLLQKDRIKQQEETVNFDFDIRSISTESFLEEINNLNLNYEDFITVIGNRTLVNINKDWNEKDRNSDIQTKYVRKDDKRTPKLTFTLATTFLMSHASESRRCLAYFDTETKKIPNWSQICLNLKNLASSSGYTRNDVKQSLLTFIREHNHDQSLYESLDIDEIAVQLIKSVKPVDRLQLLWSSLRNITRDIGTPLQLCLSQCESYINKIYDEPHKFKSREREKLYGLISFIAPQIAKDISKDMKLRREANEEVSYEYYKRIALRLEQSQEHIPKQILKYGSAKSNMEEILNWNTSNVKLNNIIFEQNGKEEILNDEDEEELNYVKYISLGTHVTSKPEPIIPFKEEERKEDLGKIWVDRGEGDVHVYININNKYFYVRFNKCPSAFKYHLLKGLQQGKISKELILVWEANVIYHNPLTRKDFMEAKSSGVKQPNATWSAMKFKEIAKSLSSDTVDAKNSQDESFDESFHSDHSDPPLCNTTFANDSVNNKNYQSKNSKDHNNSGNNKFGNKMDRDKSDDRKALLSKISRERLQGAISKEPRSRREQYEKHKYYGESRERSLTPNKFPNVDFNRKTNTGTERTENNRYNNTRNKDASAYQPNNRYNTSNPTSRDNSLDSNKNSRTVAIIKPNDKYRNNSNDRSSNYREYRQLSTDRNTKNMSYDKNRTKYNQGQTYYDNNYRNKSIERMNTYRNPPRRSPNNSQNRYEFRSRSADSRSSRDGYRNYSLERQNNRNSNNQYPDKKYYNQYPDERYNNSNNKNYNNNKYYINDDNRTNRDEYRNYSLERQNNRRTNNQYNNNNNNSYTNNKRYTNEENKSRQPFRSRERSREDRLAYPDMIKGINCDSNYDPYYKICRKCNIRGNRGHHEFQCQKFTRYNFAICRKCNAGFHYPSECIINSTSNNSTDESSYLAQMNNTSENDKFAQIIRMLDMRDLKNAKCLE